ncbi:MAG: tetratricopeptide repeat protein [Myxococcaceae bacterium]|nr:tetratricopeptide repeat protein [Myxococcaceae bacterium]
MVHRHALLLASAIALFAGTARADPPVAEVHKKVREIESAVIRGQADTLRLELEQKARNRPGDVLLRIYIAWCAMPSDETWNALKGVTAIYPDQPWARFGMGRVYGKWKMKDRALAEFDRVLKADPRFYPALVGKGDVMREAGDLDTATALYQKALQIQDDPEAHAGLGLTLLKKGDTAAAKQELTRAIALWPDQPKVLTELVALARKEQDAAAASKWARALAELQPRDPQAHRLVADLALEAGDKAQAAAEYERAIRLGAVDTATWKKLAAIYQELGRADDEQRALEQLSSLERQVADHPLRLSELYEAKGQLEQAESQLLEAISRAPTRADLHARLAKLRMKAGNPREALEAYRAALAAPDHPVEGLQAEAKALADRFKLPAKPVKGSIDAIYGRISASLNALYLETVKKKPGLEGVVKIRVRVGDDGVVQGAEVIDDTLGDPWLVGHAYFALKDAVFPKKKREPIFEFELKAPARGKK